MDSEQVTQFPANIGRPALNALAAAGYTRLEELTSVSEAELLKLHGMGPKGIRILRAALQERGLSFAGPPQRNKTKP
jgi:DNA-directed RNA polymerase alpha subunit